MNVATIDCQASLATWGHWDAKSTSITVACRGKRSLALCCCCKPLLSWQLPVSFPPGRELMRPCAWGAQVAAGGSGTSARVSLIKPKPPVHSRFRRCRLGVHEKTHENYRPPRRGPAGSRDHGKDYISHLMAVLRTPRPALCPLAALTLDYPLPKRRGLRVLLSVRFIKVIRNNQS